MASQTALQQTQSLSPITAKSSTGLVDLIEGKTRALTVRELAMLLSVSERQVYKLASENLIPSFRICGSIRFDPAATADWLRRKMNVA